MSQTIDYAALLAELQKQAAAQGTATPGAGTATPANPNIWQNPGQTRNTATVGAGGTHGFYRPNDSKLPTGEELGALLAGQGGPMAYTNQAIKYDGGLTREMLGNTTGFLSNQINSGFGTQYTAMEDLFNKYGSLGGLGGVAQSGNASAVYRPQGQVNAQNGTSLPWASTNPFNATF